MLVVMAWSHLLYSIFKGWGLSSEIFFKCTKHNIMYKTNNNGMVSLDLDTILSRFNVHQQKDWPLLSLEICCQYG